MTNYSPEDRASRAIAEAIARNKGENVAFYVAEQICQAEQAAYERAAQIAETTIELAPTVRLPLGRQEAMDWLRLSIAKEIRALAQEPEEVD